MRNHESSSLFNNIPEKKAGQGMSGLGRSLMIIGVVLVVIGLVISFAPRLPWLGKLPGDILIKKENFNFYFPLASCILISIGM